MLKPRSPQASFYGNYLYDRIVPVDHLLRKINQVVDFSFVNKLLRDRYTPDFGRPAEDPEFMLRLCLLQYLYGDSDREVIANARVNLAYKYFLGLAVDEEVPDDSTICYFRTRRLGEEKFRQVFEQIVKQCTDKGLVKGKRRDDVIREIQQNREVAEKLRLKEPQFTSKIADYGRRGTTNSAV